MTAPSFTSLATLARAFPAKPGVYQMLNASGKVIYVGKARQLKKRVLSYFSRALDTKTQQMLSQVSHIDVIVTSNEVEALLLESNLIKTLKPRYNVLLRDDKSYPYLYFSTDQRFPRLDFYRGARHGKGVYFGPYPSAKVVRETLALVQRLFKIRQCSDSFFSHRSRPCLQHQIKRCTAPCVGFVSDDRYAKQVQHAVLFLQGKNTEVVEGLTQAMQQAASKREYEEAVFYRDQIQQLRQMQQTQAVVGGKGNVDVVGGAERFGQVALTVLQVRGGRLLGGRHYFPAHSAGVALSDVMAAFLPQYYLNAVRANDLPDRVVLTEKVPDRDWIESTLSNAWGKQTLVTEGTRKPYHAWQVLARENAAQALSQRDTIRGQAVERLLALQKALQLPNPLSRVECVDVSHTMGKETVASCVVYAGNGLLKKAYRRYNIQGVTPGDDCAAMSQALTRRYARVKRQGGELPDVLLIDGGKGQLRAVSTVLEELQISGVTLLAVSKGAARKPGQETLWMLGHRVPLLLSPEGEAFHLIQLIRDEAHRFAITAHRGKRSKSSMGSPLEGIDGIGPKRRAQLLTYFGGLQGVRSASVQDLSQVPGINLSLAQKVFEHFHGASDSHP